MRIVIIAIFASVSLFSGIAHADIINVLSQSYNINGAIQNYWVYQGVPINDSFNESSGSPVAQAISENGYGLTEATAGADGKVTPISVQLSASAFAVNFNGSASASAYADSSITFTPLVNTMMVSASWGGPFMSDVTLTDLTSGDSLDLGAPDYLPGSASFFMVFDLSHTYIISTWVRASAGGFDGGNNSSLLLESVPEPASLLLIGSGLIGLFGLRRKFQK